jgi:hypothetical protein
MRWQSKITARQRSLVPMTGCRPEVWDQVVTPRSVRYLAFQGG